MQKLSIHIKSSDSYTHDIDTSDRYNIEEDSIQYFSYVVIPINKSYQIVSRLSVLSSQVQCITIDSLLQSIITADTRTQSSYTRQDKFTRSASPYSSSPSSSSPCPLYWLFDSLALSWPWLTHFQRLSVRTARVSYLLFQFYYFVFFLFFSLRLKGFPGSNYTSVQITSSAGDSSHCTQSDSNLKATHLLVRHGDISWNSWKLCEVKQVPTGS